MQGDPITQWRGKKHTLQHNIRASTNHTTVKCTLKKTGQFEVPNSSRTFQSQVLITNLVLPKHCNLQSGEFKL
jgi:hypothetical protein